MRRKAYIFHPLHVKWPLENKKKTPIEIRIRIKTVLI